MLHVLSALITCDASSCSSLILLRPASSRYRCVPLTYFHCTTPSMVAGRETCRHRHHGSGCPGSTPSCRRRAGSAQLVSDVRKRSRAAQTWRKPSSMQRALPAWELPVLVHDSDARGSAFPAVGLASLQVRGAGRSQQAPGAAGRSRLGLLQEQQFGRPAHRLGVPAASPRQTIDQLFFCCSMGLSHRHRMPNKVRN